MVNMCSHVISLLVTPLAKLDVFIHKKKFT